MAAGRAARAIILQIARSHQAGDAAAAGVSRTAIGPLLSPAQPRRAERLPIDATIGTPTNGKCPMNWTHQRKPIVGGR